jgi:Domain of Unknown Function with PDB structure (DUF3858)/Domain of Unknown Function with PDB structure (DUF3857)
MNRLLVILLSIFLIIACSNVHAQKKNEKFKINKVTVEDVQKKIYPIDSSAAAIVLFDIGNTEFIGSNTGGFSFKFKRHKRVHILNKAAYDAADVTVHLYHSIKTSYKEVLNTVEGTTYNIEEGKLVATKLERRKEIFNEKIDKNMDAQKFTLPNVKEGAIIDYEYTVVSDFLYQLQGWDFQTNYPTLWSEYYIIIPEVYEYITLVQGYLPFYIENKSEGMQRYSLHNNSAVSENGMLQSTANQGFTCNNIYCRYVIKDAPVLKAEPFISTLKNYASKITFQLKAVRRNDIMEDVTSSYKMAAKELLEDENYGQNLQIQNDWLDDDMKPMMAHTLTQLDKAKAIYYYVRDNFVCTDNSGYMLQNSLKSVFKNKKGSVAEINLLLTTMLWHAQLNATSVILGTRGYGISNALYPIMEKFNYVIVACQIDSTQYLLDATNPLLGFNHLPLKCYNFHARKINELATPIFLNPDYIVETKTTSVFMSVEKGIWGASFQQKNDYYNSLSIREDVKEKGRVKFFENIKKGYGIDGLKISKTYIDSLNKLDENIELGYEFEFTPEQQDVIYLNPMFDEATKDNPFKSANRYYPVEMPYAFDEVYTFNLDIPAGYVVVEKPTSTRIILNENEGMFEYIVNSDAEKLQLRSRIKLKKATFEPVDYNTLREFYAAIVKKHAEQIVIKRKK